MNKNFIISFFIGLIVGFTGIYIVYTKYKKPEIKTEIKTVVKYKYIKENNSTSLLCINKKDLEHDLQQYKDISLQSKKIILENIFKNSKKYNLNPLVVYAVIATESGFRFWIRHSVVKITVNKRKIQTRAIGLGGVIWEIWNKELIENNITQTKSDLFRISNNIEATSYILAKYKEQKKIKGIDTKQESAFLRYFGGGVKNKWYIDRVNKILARLMKDKLYKEEIKE